MMKHIKIILLAALLISVIAGALAAYNYLYDKAKCQEADDFDISATLESSDAADEDTDAVNENDDQVLVLASDFTFTDTNGETHRLADYIGKPVVLNFWASWCGPCTSELPDFEELYGNYGDRVEFLMVNLTDGYQETKDSALQFIEDGGYILPFYFDTKGEGVKAYGIYTIPQTFVIDEKGYITAQYVGKIRSSYVEKNLKALLK